jgi:hypothetical protein
VELNLFENYNKTPAKYGDEPITQSPSGPKIQIRNSEDLTPNQLGTRRAHNLPLAFEKASL